MSCNLGGIERTIRIVLGVVLIAIGYVVDVPYAVAVVAYLMGAIALATGALGFCPAWKLFGINTCHTRIPAKG